MNEKHSTFDKLVQTLSSNEAKALLATVKSSIAQSSAEAEAEGQAHSFQHNSIQIHSLKEEPALFRVWLRIRSFFKSITLEALYENEILRRLGKDLQHNADRYINVRHYTLTKDFYEELNVLHKTQLFFSGLLSAYDSDKGMFYLILSSYVAPVAYEHLLYDTDPFSIVANGGMEEQTRTAFLRQIDNDFATLSAEEKTTMYEVARAIEWMKEFCDIPFERMLLKFSGGKNSAGLSCPLDMVQDELGLMATLVLNRKTIPDVLLEALFVLSTEEKLRIDELNLHQQSKEFIEQASVALSSITTFSVHIPILDFVRFATQNVHWSSHHTDSGEDWFLLFKNAWRKRFNEKWTTWALLRRQEELQKRMCDALEVEELQSFPDRPWEGLWLALSLKRRLSVDFLITFFKLFYEEKFIPPLKTILIEGNFYRRENSQEFTQAFNALHSQKRALDSLQEKLSPIGELGSQFSVLQQEHASTLIGKNRLQVLVQGIDAQLHEFIEVTTVAFKSIESILIGLIGGGRTSIYATLVNWGNIKGNQNAAFRLSVENIQKSLHTGLSLLADATTLECDPTEL